MLDSTFVHSNLADGELTPPLTPYAAWRAECIETYRALRENFCRNRMVYCGTRSLWHFFDYLRHRISVCLAEARGP